MMKFPDKDPDSTLPYQFSWVAWLANESSDTILSYVVAIDAGDDALTVEDDDEDAGVITVWLAGGTLGTRYTVRTRITTTAGRVEDMSRSIFIASK